MPRLLDRTILPTFPENALSVTLLALACAAQPACSKKPSSDAVPALSSATPAPLAAEPKAAGPLKVAFAYVGPVGDAGWTYAHDKARKEAEAAFAGKVKTSFVENVPEAADAERVIRDMVEQGNTLIFGTTFGYMEPMLKVASDNPKVHFEHATGYKTAVNLRTYDSPTKARTWPAWSRAR